MPRRHTAKFLRAAAPARPLLLAVAVALALALLMVASPPAARAQTAALGNPANLTATPGPGIGEVTLTWTPAANATLHLVAYRPVAGGDYQWRLVGAGSATFSDLAAGQEYWFIVIGGQPGNAWSQWSNWGRAAALAPPPPPQPDAKPAITAGGKHTCYLDADGIVQCWGANGDADRGQADPPAGAFAAISAGYEHTCGLRPDGRIECWGDNAAGQSTPPPGVFAAVDAGRAHTCGLRADGTATCWGQQPVRADGRAARPVHRPHRRRGAHLRAARQRAG